MRSRISQRDVERQRRATLPRLLQWREHPSIQAAMSAYANQMGSLTHLVESLVSRRVCSRVGGVLEVSDTGSTVGSPGSHGVDVGAVPDG